MDPDPVSRIRIREPPKAARQNFQNRISHKSCKAEFTKPGKLPCSFLGIPDPDPCMHGPDRARARANTPATRPAAGCGQLPVASRIDLAMLIENAEIEGESGFSVRIHGDRIAEIAPGLIAQRGEERLDALGAALLPGLHDHHLHLFALAASRTSLECGPPSVRDADGLAAAAASGRGVQQLVPEPA